MDFFWNGFEPIMRILVVGTLTYFGIILILRVSGKRTLASMNAFDFIITIAMGSAFGRILTAKGVSVSEALVTFLLLVTLQYLVTAIEVRSQFFSRLITSQPVLLYYDGAFHSRNMRRERIRRDDLLGQVRQQQISSMDEVEAIILETSGNISVISKTGEKGQSSYRKLLNSWSDADTGEHRNRTGR